MSRKETLTVSDGYFLDTGCILKVQKTSRRRQGRHGLAYECL